MKTFIALVLGIFLYAQTVNICDDVAEWPPYIFTKTVKGKKQLVGISVDIADEIFKRIGKKHSIKLIPWKRCVYLVDHYDKVHKYEMFMDGTYSKKRAEKFYITDVIYYTHPAACFNKDKTDAKKLYNTLNKTPEKLRYCDVNGYQTDTYYKLLGLKRSVKIDQGAKNTCDVLKKISQDRCDVMIGAYEGTLGYVISGKCKMPANIEYLHLPDVYRTGFYMFISKKYPEGEKLLKEINSALKKMKEDGTYQKIMDKWLKNSF